MGASTIKKIFYQPEILKKEWQEYHDRNNDVGKSVAKHVVSHLVLLGISIRMREKKEILRQSWLTIAVVPVSIRDRVSSNEK